MRDVEGRISWFLNHRPSAVGMCAQHTWLSLDVPPGGYPDATAAYLGMANKVYQGPAPRGSIMLWTGGGSGHGHAALSLGNGEVASTDVNGARTVGRVPFTWFARHWPSLKYRGWTWWWGKTDTQPEEMKMATWPAVGSKKVVEIPKVALTPSKYVAVGRVDLPAGEYILTLQGRLPTTAYARVQFTRVGWGSDPDGRDETGSTPWTPPDNLATSFSHSHPMSGGGPVEYEIKIVGGTYATNVVVKATRIA